MKSSKREEILDILSGFADEITSITTGDRKRSYPKVACESLAEQAMHIALAYNKHYNNGKIDASV